MAWHEANAKPDKHLKKNNEHTRKNLTKSKSATQVRKAMKPNLNPLIQPSFKKQKKDPNWENPDEVCAPRKNSALAAPELIGMGFAGRRHTGRSVQSEPEVIPIQCAHRPPRLLPRSEPSRHQPS